MNIAELKNNKLKELEQLEVLEAYLTTFNERVETLTLEQLVKGYVDNMAKEINALVKNANVPNTVTYFDYDKWFNLVMTKVEPNNQWYDSVELNNQWYDSRC